VTGILWGTQAHLSLDGETLDGARGLLAGLLATLFTKPF
jgi:hypothetical protein